jgi:hypothetical protein
MKLTKLSTQCDSGGVLEVINWSRDVIRLPAQNVSHDQSLSCLCTSLRSAATPLGSNLQQNKGSASSFLLERVSMGMLSHMDLKGCPKTT